MQPPRPTPLRPANQLLTALPAAEYQRLLPHLESVPLGTRAILCQPGEAIPHVYFPCSGVLSLLAMTGNGRGIEVGLVGREGLVGLPIFLGDERSAVRCIVQVPGDALRARAEVFRSEVDNLGPLHELVRRYAGAFLTQVSHWVACNSLHSVKRRCCRWLLMTHDRVGADRFPLTQDFLAWMLGVRRASISDVAQALQQDDLIHYSRGQITVLDRHRLESNACECYHTVRREYDRLLL
jgi:CRP-like cAMP-binding protein